MRLTIFLDMDGVITQFEKFAELFGETMESLTSQAKPQDGLLTPVLKKVCGVGVREWRRIIRAQGHGWWRDLPEYPWFNELIKTCKKYGRVYICSDPGVTFSANASFGKIRWLEDRFGEGYKYFILTKHKHLLADGPNTVLIDDSEDNLEKFRAKGGSCILFPQSWNSNSELADEHRVSIVEKRLKEISNFIKGY